VWEREGSACAQDPARDTLGDVSQQADKLFEDAQALPDEERAILALQLLDSVGEAESAIEQAWRDEVKRRIEDIDASRATLASWDDAKRRIFARK
jgi:putative addiction module component (TIGR02574 family)